MTFYNFCPPNNIPVPFFNMPHPAFVEKTIHPINYCGLCRLFSHDLPRQAVNPSRENQGISFQLVTVMAQDWARHTGQTTQTQPQGENHFSS